MFRGPPLFILAIFAFLAPLSARAQNYYYVEPYPGEAASISPTNVTCDSTIIGAIRYNAVTAVFEGCNGTAWGSLAASGVATNVPLSGITAATGANTVDSGLNAQVWNWNSLLTTNGLTLGSSSLTSGSILFVSSASASVTGAAISASLSAAGNTGAAVSATNASATGFGGFFTNTAAGGIALGVNGPYTMTVANEGVTGTTVNMLAKLNGANPSKAIIAAMTDTAGIIGVVMGGAGTAGNAQIAYSGLATCAFDATTAPTAGHYVQISPTVAGKCRDTGSTTPPASNEIIGIVMTTGLVSTSQSVWLYLQNSVGGSGSPAAPATAIQFNNSGAFGGSANLEWDGTKLTASNVNTGSLTGAYEINGTPVLALPSADANFSLAVGPGVLTSGSLSGAGNTGVGQSALHAVTTGANNTAIGTDALQSTTTGTDNTAIGYQAMQGVSGNPLTGVPGFNVALGHQALLVIQGGAEYDIGIGAFALAADTTGPGNVAIGYTALGSMTTHSNSTAVGTGALFKSTFENEGFGYQAGYEISTGTANVAIGYETVGGSTSTALTGNNNTAVGYAALTAALSAAANNTAIGMNAGAAVTSGTNNTLVGYTAGNVVTGNSNIVLGEAGPITSGGSNIVIGNNLGTTYLVAANSNQLDIGDLVRGTTGGTDHFDITANQHIEFHGGSPTQATTTCGNASFAVSGNDNTFQVTKGTTASTTCTVNFANAWANAPVCSVTPASTTLDGAIVTVTTSTTQLTFTHATSHAAGIFYVICRGWN